MAKKEKPLSDHQKQVLEKFLKEKPELPYGAQVRTCEMLERRGLLKGVLVRSEVVATANGLLTKFRRAYKKPE